MKEKWKIILFEDPTFMAVLLFCFLYSQHLYGFCRRLYSAQDLNFRMSMRCFDARWDCENPLFVYAQIAWNRTELRF